VRSTRFSSSESEKKEGEASDEVLWASSEGDLTALLWLVRVTETPSACRAGGARGTIARMTSRSNEQALARRRRLEAAQQAELAEQRKRHAAQLAAVSAFERAQEKARAAQTAAAVAAKEASAHFSTRGAAAAALGLSMAQLRALMALLDDVATPSGPPVPGQGSPHARDGAHA
jgi:hypothetical protein